jgi:casein kinase 1
VTPTPHREHRRDREHGGRRSRQVPDGTTPNQLVLSPTPAHVKSSRRPHTGERGNASRDIGSVQPPSRRPSQPKWEVNAGSSSHPYATVQNGYRTPNFDRHSPNPAHESESFLYGQPQNGKNGSGSPEETTMAGTRHPGGQARGMMFDREQMQRVGEQDEDGDHGRKGFLGFLCCR